MTDFIPGLELNRQYFTEVVQPLLATHFPGLRYSAALMGYGSDVLGYDTPLSRDHEWGPRLLLFLDDAGFESQRDRIDGTLRAALPAMFRGYSTSFSLPDPAGGWVRRMDKGAQGMTEHHIQFETVNGFCRRELDVGAGDPWTVRDWLTFPEQKALEMTAGAVFHDGLDQLVALRERLAWYPRDIWLYRMAAQWQRIAEEEAFVGRCGDAGDDLGSRIVAARLARDIMRLCFLQERRYAPYSKWLGTGFRSLACAHEVSPALEAALAASAWRAREAGLCAAYEAVARAHNALSVTGPLETSARPYFGRPYQVIGADRFAAALLAAITDPEIRRIATDSGVAGAVDQLADCVSILQHAPRFHRLGAFFDE